MRFMYIGTLTQDRRVIKVQELFNINSNIGFSKMYQGVAHALKVLGVLRTVPVAS
jgi:hypothetical protein